MSAKKEAEKAEKRKRRLAAAVARIQARAVELYPDHGTPTQRRKAASQRQAFKQGALFWRYAQAVHHAEGQQRAREQSERDRNRANRNQEDIQMSIAGDTAWDREHSQDHMNSAGAAGSGFQQAGTATDRPAVAATEDTDSPSSPPRPTTHADGGE